MADEAAPAEIAWPYTHTFKKPATALGDIYESLTLREPTTAELLEAGVFDGGITGEGWVGLIAKLSSKPDPVIKALPGKETWAIIRSLSGFLAS